MKHSNPQLKLLFLTLFGAMIMMTHQVPAQKTSSFAPRNSNLALTQLDYSILNNILHVNFELPANGEVEFELLDGQYRRILKTDFVKERGNNWVRMRLAPLPKNQTYIFTLGYKGTSYEADFFLSN